MNPEKVIDCDGDVWVESTTGGYLTGGRLTPVPLDAIRDAYGPLTLPDGTQYGAFTPDTPPAEPLSRREALDLAREWARSDDGKIHGPLALRYARFLIGDTNRD